MGEVKVIVIFETVGLPILAVVMKTDLHKLLAFL